MRVWRRDPRVRALAIALYVAPAALALGLSLFALSKEALHPEPECWILPNGYVLRVGSPECTLRTNDLVTQLEVNGAWEPPARAHPAAATRVNAIVLRSGSERVESLSFAAPTWRIRAGLVGTAALACLFLLAIPVAVLRAERPASSAYAIANLYCAAAFIAVIWMTGRSAPGSTRVAMIAAAFIPSALLHLALCFPRVNETLRAVPHLSRIPYSLAVILVPMGWQALSTTPVAWTAYLSSVVVLTLSAWLMLLASCVQALRTTRSPLEHARARLLLGSSIFGPILPAYALLPQQATVFEFALTFAWVATVALPVSVGLAISRFSLFRTGANRAIGRVVYLATASGVVTALLYAAIDFFDTSGFDPPMSLTYLVSFASITAAELVRGRVLQFFESVMAPGASRFENLQREFRALAAQSETSEQVLIQLVESATTATGSRHCAVLVRDEDGKRAIGRGGGQALFTSSLWTVAQAVLADHSVVDLEILNESDVSAPIDVLQRAGIAAVIGVSYAGRRPGILLVGPKGKGGSYHVADLEFLNALCRSAAMALHIRRDTSWAMESARDDATTKVAVALAHDLGKEVDWMTRLVRRLPDIATNRGLLERDVRLATDLSRNVSRGLRRFVREATDGRGEPETVLIDDLIDDAVRRVARVHGEDRITPMVDPALGDTRIHRDLERVIANLLDNAIHASPETESVRLFARRVNHGTEIVVEDQGVGFSEEQSPKLFRPGFTTRGDRGGLGVGLSACRDILRELGGCMELYSGPEGGTRARVLLPTS